MSHRPPEIQFPVENEAINKIAKICDKSNVEAYLVGGFVRDLVLGIESKDIDICVVGNAIEFAGVVADSFGIKLKAIYKKFGTALLELDDGTKIEFATTRTESYERNSRKPIVEFASLDKDLSRRDFTINAIALSLLSTNKYPQ